MKLIRDSVTLFVDKITVIEPEGYVRDVYGFANENGEVVIPHKYDRICEVLGELAIVVIENDEKSYKVINAQGTMLYEYDDLQWHHDFNRGAVCLDGKWGVVNELFEVICPIKYEDIAWYNENTIFVRLNDKWGAVNFHNELICDFMFDDLVQPPFCCERVNIFEGFRIESNQLIGICINDKWGFMTEDFNVICEPKYDSISKFANGCAAVGIGDRVGFIDENANEIYPVKYTTQSAWKIDEVIPLQDGEKYGWFDSQSKYLCEPKYDEEVKIINDYIIVTLSGKKGIMRRNGVEVCPLRNDDIEPWFTFGYPMFVAFLIRIEGKYGVFDPETGDYILEPIYDNVSNDGYDRLVETLRIGTKYGYVCVKNHKVVKSAIIYDEIKNEWNYLIVLRIGGKWGAHSIDDDNNVVEVLECKYDDINSGYGYLALGLNGKYAYAQISSKDGLVRMICDYKYDYICLDVDLAAVRSGEKWGVINADGKEICEIKYDDIRHSAQPQPFYDQSDIEYPRLFGVMLGDKWGFINVQGEEICPFQFDRIERWTSEYEGDEYAAYIGEVCYMLDKNGTFVVCS